MPSYQIKNKVFFITGGAQGFGMEIAQGVLAKGAKVSELKKSFLVGSISR